MSVRSLLNMRCTISRWTTRTPDALGHVGPATWADVKSDVRCTVQQHSAKVLRGSSGIDVSYNATGFFLPSEDLRAKAGQAEKMDRITVTNGGSGRYEVRGVLDESGRGRLLTVALEAV